MPDQADPNQPRPSEPLPGAHQPDARERSAPSPGAPNAAGAPGSGRRWRQGLAGAAALVIVAGVAALALTARLHGSTGGGGQGSYAQLPSLTGSAIAYDEATQGVVLFGGRDAGKDTAQTWSWDGHGWTQLHPAQSPPVRSSASMAWDADLNALILFGGTATSASARPCAVPNTEPAPALASPASSPDGAAQPPSKSTLPAGSLPVTSTPSSVGSVSPSAAIGVTKQLPPSMPVQQPSCPSTTMLTDTWSFVGGSWTELPTVTHPRVGPSSPMVWDAAHHQLVLLSGDGLAQSIGGAGGSSSGGTGVSGSGSTGSGGGVSSTGSAGSADGVSNSGSAGSSSTGMGPVSTGIVPRSTGMLPGATAVPAAPGALPQTEPTVTSPMPTQIQPGIAPTTPVVAVGTYTFDGRDWVAHPSAAGPAAGAWLVTDSARGVLAVQAAGGVCTGLRLGVPDPIAGQPAASGVSTCAGGGGTVCSGGVSNGVAIACPMPATVCPDRPGATCAPCGSMPSAGMAPTICQAPAASSIWNWNGSAWTANSTVSPGPTGVAFATGTPSGVLALGWDGTWTLSATTWTRHAPQQGPLAQTGVVSALVGGAWDAATHQVVLVFTSSQGTATWTWDGQSWTLAAGVAPSPMGVPSILPAPGSPPGLPSSDIVGRVTGSSAAPGPATAGSSGSAQPPGPSSTPLR